MIALEIAMLLIGLGAVAVSFRLSEKRHEEEEDEYVPVKEAASAEQDRISAREWEQRMEKLKTDAEDVYQDIDDKISRLSNEKIIGMSEYSDQVLDKIEKNHGEVVFLYDMMNEKQEELKKLVHQIDQMKADMKNEAEREHQKLSEQENKLEQIRKDIEVENLEIQAAIREDQERRAQLQKEEQERRARLEEEEQERRARLEEEKKEAARRERMKRPAKWDVEKKPMKSYSERKAERELEEAKKQEQQEELKRQEEEKKRQAQQKKTEEKKDENDDKKSLQDIIQDVFFGEDTEEPTPASNVIDAEIARIEEAEAREQKQEAGLSEGYMPLAEQEKPVNHNNEIVSLYKKGHSIIEISKMLSLGQGEVKFVIDLYRMR